MRTIIGKKLTRKDQETAIYSLRAFSEAKDATAGKNSGVINVKFEDSEATIAIPYKAIELLHSILLNMAKGQSITLLLSDTEITTQQAAEILGMSRPHVVKLIEDGVIPHKKVGTHRRILLQDIIDYDAKIRKQREDSLEFLAEQAQDLKLGYE
jgi:excisionase family DNA binding protein